MDVDQEDDMVGDFGGSGEQGRQDEEAEVYLGALHDTARSPYVLTLLLC